MNYQFFGTAGICSGVLWVVALVMLLCVISDHFSWDTEDVLNVIAWVCFLLPIAFWLVVGVLCGLSELWGWGLVIL